MRALQILLFLSLAGFAFGEIIVASPLSNVHTVSPGGTLDNVIVVENTGSEEARVRIYQTDYLFQADGSNNYGQPGSISRSNAPWITLDRSSFTLAAGARAEVAYRVSVPHGKYRGSYWSVVMVEEVVPPLAQSEGVGVRTVVRYGIQIVTEFGSSGEPFLEFANPSLSGDATAGYELQVDAHNRGETMLRGSFYLELYEKGGALMGRFEGRPLRTYPGTSVRQRFRLGVLPPGPYTALVISDPGGDELFGAQYDLNVNERER